MKTLTFPGNWNNKLACESFVAIVPHQTGIEYKDKETFGIVLSGKELMKAELVDIRIVATEELTEFDCHLNGYSRQNTIEEFQACGQKQVAVLLLKRIWNVFKLVPNHLKSA